MKSFEVATSLFILGAGASLVLAQDISNQSSSPAWTVAVVADGPSPIVDDMTRALVSELEALDARFQVESEMGAWTAKSVEQALQRALGHSPNVLLALGPVASERASRLPSPHVVSALTLAPSDVEGAVTLASLAELSRDVPLFIEVSGRSQIRRLGVAVDTYALGALVGWQPFLSKAQEDLGLTLVPVAVDPNANTGPLNDLDGLIWSLVLRPTDLDRTQAFQAAAAAGVPTMDAVLYAGVEQGALLTALPQDITRLRARRVALEIQAIVQEEELRGFAPIPQQLAINVDVARELGTSIPFEILSEATTLESQEDADDPVVRLGEASSQAIASNPGLEAARQELEANRQGVLRSRGSLLPALSASLSADWIDEDRGAGPFPPAERQLSWAGQARQSVFSADAWRIFKTEQQQQQAREAEFEAASLDVQARAAVLFLEVLRAVAAENIQRENLGRLRLNLSLARVRKRIGAASRDEVSRFEVEVAQGKRAVIEAVANRNQAEIAFNIFVNEKPERSFRPASEQEESLLGLDRRLQSRLDDPVTFKVFREFAEREAIRFSPEMKAIEWSVKAAERDVKGRIQSLIIPRFDLNASMTHRFAADGEGSASAPDGVGFVIPDQYDWALGATAELPLFEGLSRYVAIDQSKARVASAVAAQREVELSVAGRVRSALHAAGASRPGVRLSAEAARAAEDTLDLVRDAYRTGQVDIIRLVDAQIQYLTTRLDATDARYDFLIDFVEVERALSHFSFGPEPYSNEQFFESLRAFEADRGLETQP